MLLGYRSIPRRETYKLFKSLDMRHRKKCCLTKRAPDAGDSAQISGSFLAGRLRRPRPSAGTHRALSRRKPLART